MARALRTSILSGDGGGDLHGSVLLAIPDPDHIVDPDGMILHTLPAVETSREGLGDQREKVAVIHVAEHAGKIPAGPKLVAHRVRPADLLKGRDFVAH